MAVDQKVVPTPMGVVVVAVFMYKDVVDLKIEQ